MAAEKKIKKDKEIVLELESQIRDIHQQLTDQLRSFDQHLDCHVGMLGDLQEYYRRNSEVEIEFSRSLDKLAKQLSMRQRRDPLAAGYSTHATWQMLVDSTRQQSRNHGFLGDIFNPVMVNKLADLSEDIQRIHRRCREMMTTHHDELSKVLTELENTMKTYHTYHGNSQQAETKLLRVQSQRVKVDQQNALSKRFINYDKKAEQKHAKYMENKLKALKARNDYLLCIDSANAALHKYFMEDFPKVAQKMDFGYHTTLTQTVNIHITATSCLLSNDQDRLDAFVNQSRSIIAAHDNAHFRSQYQKLFIKPEDFEFQPHKGDEICQISAQKAVQDDMLARITAIKERIDSNRKENLEIKSIHRAAPQYLRNYCKETHSDASGLRLRSLQKTDLRIRNMKARFDDRGFSAAGPRCWSGLPLAIRSADSRLRKMETVELELITKITLPDIDILQLFRDEKTGMKSPTDKDKRRDERLKFEDNYLQLFHEYMKADSLSVRLNSKFIALRKALGEGACEAAPSGVSSDPVRKRPPSLPPKPKKLVKKSAGGQPRLFGGSIEEYVEATGLQIPIVVRSCIRIINLYGMHHQGIFRVSGSQNDINNYKQQFEKGIDPLTTKVEGDDINSVAGLLKLYFRELKEPLFPPDKFQPLIASPEKFSGNEEDFKSDIRAIMSLLLRPRVVVMRYLFAFLNHLSEFSDENMMDAYNLAICFGPTLLPTAVSPDLCNHIYVNKLVENIIIHHEDIFSYDGDVVYEKCIVESEKDFLESMSDDDLLSSNIPDEDDELRFADVVADIEDHEAIAEYDYQGRSDKELSFHKGDVLMLFNRVSCDWWNGELMGQKGLIPDKYILPVRKSIRERPSNLKKGYGQAKSSECLLSPDDVADSPTSSLDRSISQPNVAVPVPSLPQLGIPATDLPSSTHASQALDDPTANVTVSLDSALAKVNCGLEYLEKIEQRHVLGIPNQQQLSSTLENDLDVVIPVSVRPPSPFSRELQETQPKLPLATFAVKKSTSFRTAKESAAAEHPKVRHLTSDAAALDQESADKLLGSTPSLASLSAAQEPPATERKNAKSSTLPPNLQPPHFGMHSTSGFDSELLEEINSFSTFPRSSLGDKQQRVVPPVKPRPPVKKTSDASKSPAN